MSTLKTIGILGGMSWESSALYYRDINLHIRAAKGGLHSAPVLLDSVDFAPIAAWLADNNWAALSDFLQQHAQKLEAAGAQCIGIATNTMHKVFDQVAAAVNVPLIHIASPTIAALQAANCHKIGFLGTRYSMEQDFLRSMFESAGVTFIVPNAAEIDVVHGVIFDELVQGIVTEASRAAYQRIIERLAAQGAQAVVFGCTEIGTLLGADDVSLPIFDTTTMHTRALADFCLG